MSFAGKVWKLLVGIKDGLVLVFMLLFFALVYAVLTTRPSPGQVREGALLLALDGSVVEEPSIIDPVSLLISGTVPAGEYAARDLTRAIDTAATDDRIKAVVLDLSRFTGGGQVHMQAIGDALDRVRAAKKPVLTYALAYGDDALLIASHASEVWIDPMGGALPTGSGRQQPLLRRPVRALRRQGAHLPRRHLQERGRSPTCCRACRPPRARPRRRSTARCGASGRPT